MAGWTTDSAEIVRGGGLFNHCVSIVVEENIYGCALLLVHYSLSYGQDQTTVFRLNGGG